MPKHNKGSEISLQQLGSALQYAEAGLEAHGSRRGGVRSLRGCTEELGPAWLTERQYAGQGQAGLVARMRREAKGGGRLGGAGPASASTQRLGELGLSARGPEWRRAERDGAEDRARERERRAGAHAGGAARADLGRLGVERR